MKFFNTRGIVGLLTLTSAIPRLQQAGVVRILVLIVQQLICLQSIDLQKKYFLKWNEFVHWVFLKFIFLTSPSVFRLKTQNRFLREWFLENLYTPEFLDLMKSAGCHTLIIGIESKNFESLKSFGRVFSEKKLHGLLEHANRLKINICGDFIIGLPGESITDIRSTIAYATNLQLDFASFNIATPLPSTLFRRQAVSAGRMKVSDHHFDTTGMSHILDSDTVNAEDLVALRNEAIRQFYIKPQYWLRRLSRIRGTEHFYIQIQEAFALIKNTFFFRRTS
jgi:hypothetical protein